MSCYEAERGPWRDAERQAAARFEDDGAGGGAGGDRVSEPEAAPEPEHPLLPGVHAAVTWSAAGRIGGAGPGVCGCGKAGCLLGVQPEPVGYGGGNSAGDRGRRTVTDFAGGEFRLDSREVLASNGLIHDEMVGLFEDMFAGRGLTPIPTPEEFAAQRMARAKGLQ